MLFYFPKTKINKAFKESPDFTLADARALYADQDIVMEMAMNKIKFTARYNPFFMPFGTFMNKGVALKIAKYELDKETFFEKFKR